MLISVIELIQAGFQEENFIISFYNTLLLRLILILNGTNWWLIGLHYDTCLQHQNNTNRSIISQWYTIFFWVPFEVKVPYACYYTFSGNVIVFFVFVLDIRLAKTSGSSRSCDFNRHWVYRLGLTKNSTVIHVIVCVIVGGGQIKIKWNTLLYHYLFDSILRQH